MTMSNDGASEHGPPPPDGIWSVELTGERGEHRPGGVLVLQRGRLLGGDSRYLYTGECELREAHVECLLEAKLYSGRPSSLLGGQERVQLRLSGNLFGREMYLQGKVLSEPSKIIYVRLVKRMQLRERLPQAASAGASGDRTRS